MARGKAAVTAAAFVALVGVVGAAGYLVARDEPAPATTTTTTTTPPPTPEEVAMGIEVALREGLDVELDASEARCVTEGLLDLLGQERLETIDGNGSALTEAERGELVRMVVLCIPPEKAAVLLTPAPTTTVAVELPDEGTDQ